MTYRQANKNRYTRSCRALALVEALAIEAGYTVKGNDKSGIDRFLDEIESGTIEVTPVPPPYWLGDDFPG